MQYARCHIHPLPKKTSDYHALVCALVTSLYFLWLDLLHVACFELELGKQPTDASPTCPICRKNLLEEPSSPLYLAMRKQLAKSTVEQRLAAAETDTIKSSSTKLLPNNPILSTMPVESGSGMIAIEIDARPQWREDRVPTPKPQKKQSEVSRLLFEDRGLGDEFDGETFGIVERLRKLSHILVNCVSMRNWRVFGFGISPKQSLLALLLGVVIILTIWNVTRQIIRVLS